MKTTLMIPDPLFRQVKMQAAAKRRTMSDLVAELLQIGLRQTSATAKQALAPLPSYDMGAARVDVANRDALERAMGE